jgi:hypothetical protein
MTDDLKQRSADDGERIHVDREQELHEWARKFDASPQQIKEAVQAVGDRADRVEMYLKGSRSTMNSERTRRAEGPD